jgi:protein gp37
MFSEKTWYGQNPKVVIRSKPGTFDSPIARFGPRSTKGTPGEYRWVSGGMVFTCSWSDWFHPDADAWRDDAWAIVKSRPDLIFQVLTKRPELVLERLPKDWGDGYPNVWMGVSVEDQKRVDLRIPQLEAIPAAVRFLSVEPLLERVILPTGAEIDWVIVGGESGARARVMDPDWAREVRDYCDREKIAFFFKQWGAYNDAGKRVGKKKAGCEIDGLERKEFPASVTPSAGV